VKECDEINEAVVQLTARGILLTCGRWKAAKVKLNIEGGTNRDQSRHGHAAADSRKPLKAIAHRIGRAIFQCDEFQWPEQVPAHSNAFADEVLEATIALKPQRLRKSLRRVILSMHARNHCNEFQFWRISSLTPNQIRKP
jgi:hypothetical protein